MRCFSHADLNRLVSIDHVHIIIHRLFYEADQPSGTDNAYRVDTVGSSGSSPSILYCPKAQAYELLALTATAFSYLQHERYRLASAIEYPCPQAPETRKSVGNKHGGSALGISTKNA